jgi:hypothetical protein
MVIAPVSAWLRRFVRCGRRIQIYAFEALDFVAPDANAKLIGLDVD